MYVEPATSWPSWLFVCSALALDCWEIIYTAPLGLWAQYARLQFPSVSWISLASPLPPSSLLVSQPSWPCLIQTDRFPDHFGPLLTHRPVSRLSLSHAEAGGVTDAVCTFSSNRPFSVSTAPGFCGARRGLKNIVNKASRQSSSTASRSKKNFRTTIQWELPVPIKGVLWKAHCASVFSRTGWVVRRLTLPELMVAYDVPTKLCPADPGEWTELPFLNLPPFKLLQSALQRWEGIEVKSLLLSSPRTVDDTSRLPQVPQSMYIAQGSKENRIEFLTSTKADSAEAFADQWNDRILNHFPDARDKRTLFMIRSQGSCPLDLLRSWCLRRWRRNVLRSFLQFLKSEHGVPWQTNAASDPDLMAGRSCL